MHLSQLLSIYPQYKLGENPSRSVSKVSFDSRDIDEETVFVAIKGHRFDAHDFLPEVAKKNVAALVVEDPSGIPEDFSGAVVKVKDSRVALSQICNRFYSYPCDDLFCVGVSGTNGKTSTSYMIECILSHFGWDTGVMGTIDHHLKSHIWESQLTTPDPVNLFKRLHEFKSLGAKAVSFEVSSHAIEQSRTEGIPFDVVVFTNLSRDHLDYHGDMESYFKAKEKLYREIIFQSNKKSKFAIINVDDEYGRKIQVADGVRAWTYGQKNADIQFQVVKANFKGSYFKVATPRGEGEGFLPIAGRVFLYNAVAAISVGLCAGVSLEASLKALSEFKGIPGRLESVSNEKDFNIFVDYAHTPDALENVLKTLFDVKEQDSKNSKIICVFGCGGDRDKGKRPLMMAAALNYSDIVFVTSDNPRTEDPDKIIAETVAQVDPELMGQVVFTESNRATAISRALRELNQDDVLLIAGKGHEDYQIIGTEKTPFNDVGKVKELLGEL